MRRSAVVAGALLLAAGGAAGLWAAMKPEVAPPGSVAASSPPAAPAAPAPPVSVPARRAGRVFSVADAVKELDLIVPARPKAAEDFTVPLAKGSREPRFRMADQRGRVVLLNFWATWCPPCLEEMPALDRLHRQHKDAGLVLLAVSLDTATAAVSPFVAKHKLGFLVGLDSRSDVASAYGVRALPSSFVIDRDGRVAAIAIGPRAWDNDAAHSLIEGLVR